MIDLKLRVVPEDGAAYMVAPKLGTLVAAERHFGKTLSELFATPGIEHIAWLAWEQTRRDGIVVKPFDMWVDTIGDIETEVDADPLDVTR